MQNLLAQRQIDIPGALEGLGILGLEGRNPSQAPTLFNTFLSSMIGILTIIASIWFVFSIITGAISIISSGGDKASLESAKKKIMTGLIGIVVVVASLFIIDLIGNLLGLDLILNPGEYVQRITPWGP